MSRQTTLLRKVLEKNEKFFESKIVIKVISQWIKNEPARPHEERPVSKRV